MTLDNDERAILEDMFRVARRRYEESAINALGAVGNDINYWQCLECGHIGPRRSRIVHGSLCFFQRMENLRVKLLATAPDPSARPDSPTS